MVTDPFAGRLLKERYLVESELGRGGMATVYLARDRDLDRPVVVKIPDPALLRDESFRVRFELEVRSMVDLHHAHVVSVLDAGEDDGTPFVVLDHLEGGSLKDRLDATVRDGERQSPEEILSWLEPVARALDFVHSRDVIHRDVKPANILFDRSGDAFVSDFGLAKALGALDSSLTRTGTTPGTPMYLAPEAGKGDRLTGAADQYSLGVILYEALAGFIPLEADTPLAVMVKKMSEDPDPIGVHCPELPRAAAAAVMKALAREPGDRFANCLALVAAFREGLAGSDAEIPVAEKIVADVPVAEVLPEDTGRPPARRLLPALLVGGLAVAAGLFFLLQPGGGGDPAPPTPPPPAQPGPELTVTSPDVSGTGRWTRVRILSVMGRVETTDLVELRICGDAVRPREDGSFSQSRPLDVGLNTITVTARDRAGETRRVEREIVLDILPPKLWVFRPAEGQRVRANSVEVAGRVEDENLDRVVINGKVVPVAADLSFTTMLALKRGANTIRFEVHDRAGNHRVSDRIVTRE